VAEKDARKSQMMGVWTLGTVEQGSGRRRNLVLDMFANRGSLIRAAQDAGVRLHEAESKVSDPPGSDAHLYSVRTAKTLLVWSGGTAGDSTRLKQPIAEAWSIPGLRQGAWVADLDLAPAWSRPMVGSLTVEGKGDLAKALKASPIRFVGPYYRGGAGELRLSR
jgi:hypothetical protein